MKNRAYLGASAVIPVLAAKPVNPGDGLDMTAFAVSTKVPFRATRYVVTAPLSGGTSVDLVLYVRVGAGWARCADAGNLGLLGGQTLPTGDTYAFTVSDVGEALEAVLVKQNNVGGVVVGACKMQAIEED